MKILRIIARLNVGGPARHVVWLTDALDDEEFESVLVAGTVPPTEEDMGYFAEQHGVRPIFIEEMSRELSPKDVVSLWKVWRTVIREKPDVIHTHTAKAGTIGRAAGFVYRWLTPGTLIGRPRRVKLIHTYHGHIFHSYYGKAKTRFFLFIERTLARLATDRIITITEQQRREIHEDFGVGRAEQFEVIPLGIDLSVFENADERRSVLREEIGAGDDDIVVAIVGRLTEIKDHELFLRAVARYDELQFVESGDGRKVETQGDRLKPIVPLRFVIVGDGHLRAELETLASEYGISDRVTFLGNRKDPEVFYAGADIVALTSKNEGTPLSLIEAMASRRPVVSTAVGGVVDLLRDGRPETGDRGDVGAGPVPAHRPGANVGAGPVPAHRPGANVGAGPVPDHSPGANVGAGPVPAHRPEGEDNHREHGESQRELVGESSASSPLSAHSSPLTAHSSQLSADGPPLTSHGSPIRICDRGVAVASRDPADFARALAMLAADPDLRGQLADAGYEFVKRKYDKARLIADIKELYRKLITEN